MPRGDGIITPKGERKVGSGRKKGVLNKVTHNLRLQIVTALQEAHPDGAIAYLKQMSQQEPVAFMGLVGKCLPKEIIGKVDGDINIRQMNVHRLDISNLSEEELDALEGAMRKTYMIEHQKVIEAAIIEDETEEDEVVH